MGRVSECRLTSFKGQDVVVQVLTERMDSITFSVIGWVSDCRLTQFEEGIKDVVVQMLTAWMDSITSVNGSGETNSVQGQRCGGAGVDSADGFHHTLSHCLGE